MGRRQRIALIGALVIVDVLFTAAVLYGWSWVSRSSVMELVLGGPVFDDPVSEMPPGEVMRILPLELIALVEVALIAGFAFARHWRTLAPVPLSGPALFSAMVGALMVGRAIPGQLGCFGPIAVFSREFDRVDPLWTAIITWGPPLVAAAIIVAVGVIRSRLRPESQ